MNVLTTSVFSEQRNVRILANHYVNKGTNLKISHTEL